MDETKSLDEALKRHEAERKNEQSLDALLGLAIIAAGVVIGAIVLGAMGIF